MSEVQNFLTLMEFANRVRVHPNTIRRAIQGGRIQAVRIGIGPRAQYRIPDTELNRLCEMDMTKLIEKIIEEKLEEKKNVQG